MTSEDDDDRKMAGATEWSQIVIHPDTDGAKSLKRNKVNSSIGHYSPWLSLHMQENNTVTYLLCSISKEP